MKQDDFIHRKGFLIFIIALVLFASAAVSVYTGFSLSYDKKNGLLLFCVLFLLVPAVSFLLYKWSISPYYRRLEDANLELHLKQEELLDTKDDLFIKFLGIYDVNYAANSPRLFADRLKDVADITARVMEANACLIYLYDSKKDELFLAATNAVQENSVGKVHIPLGEGIEGWSGRRLEPVMLKDFHADIRYQEPSGLALAEYASVYCLPLYVYSNGALVGLMEVFYRKPKVFLDEEINFFTTLSGIISTTIQNEQMQIELRKMNMELEQWVSEKTEELKASEERYRKLVENAQESIFMLAQNGDIIFANDEAARLTGQSKYDLLHKTIVELFLESFRLEDAVTESAKGKASLKQAKLRSADGSATPVEIHAVKLAFMGKHFIQFVMRDISIETRLEQLLNEKEQELASLKARLENQ